VTIFWLPVSCDAEVGDPDVAGFVEDDVFGFDVSVDDVALVEVVESFDQAADEKLCIDGVLLICSSLKV
jgi:hypothetical protein